MYLKQILQTFQRKKKKTLILLERFDTKTKLKSEQCHHLYNINIRKLTRNEYVILYYNSSRKSKDLILSFYD